ncbi:MAG: tRNA dihydrouridine synthase DusB [Desulfobacterales bacterium]|jgi:nifR3 family TIM-barrel protein|nr:tRNA dihydrouridine synthase DusB [Desulfobacterales bacterium]
MKIGRLHLDRPVVLAPLAGITNLPFRLLAREAGCGLVTTEMVSADGLVHGAAATFDLLRSLPEEKPLAVQIFGSEPAVMAEAAAIVEASGADVVDLNFGCAVRKIVRTGAGVALMREPRRAEALLQAVRQAVKIPLTIKIRSGWERTGRNALAIGEMAEACGVDALTLHPRTAGQKFSGQADWALIAALKQRLRIPVIGNGDIRRAEDARRMMAETGCDAVMIGRRAIGYPQIFSEVVSCLTGIPQPVPDFDQRIAVMRRFVAVSVDCFGERRAVRLMRTRLAWFGKGMRHSAGLRKAVGGINSIEEALALIDAYQQLPKAGLGGEEISPFISAEPFRPGGRPPEG